MTFRAWSMALAFVGLVQIAHAQEQEMGELQELLGSSVVTAASQTNEMANLAPAISSNITGEQLRQYGIHTLEEAVNFLSLGMSSSGRNSHGLPAEIGARGVAVVRDEGNHVLVLLNGHHLNEPGTGLARFDRLAGIPLEIVDHIEVIVGPGSVLYGNSAMLGVINVVTKSAENYAGSHVVLEGGVPHSLRAGAGVGYQFELFGERAELTSAFEYFQMWGPELWAARQYIGDDPLTGQPVQTSPEGEPTGVWGGAIFDSNHLRVPSGLLRMRVDDWTLNVSGRLSRRGIATYSSFDDPGSFSDEHSLWGDLSYTKLLSPVVDFTARLYADGFEQKVREVSFSDFACRNVAPCQIERVRTTRWTGLELRTSFDWLQDRSLVTMIGFDGRLRDVRRAVNLYEVDSERLKLSSIGVLSRQDATFGAYVQQVYKPSRWLALNLGGRLDYDRRYAPVLTPRVALVSELWRGASARAAYAEAFRAPSHVETNLTSDGYLRPSLKPETVRSAELSLDQTVGSHRLLIAGFWSRWSRLVGRVVLSRDELERLIGPELVELLGEDSVATQLRNIAEIESAGVNAGYEGALLSDKLTFGLNATVARSRQQDGDAAGHEVPTVPRVFGNARIGYSLPAPFPSLGLAAHYLQRRPADRAFDGGFVPRPYAPAQLELRATVSGAIGHTGLSYRLTGNYAFADRGPFVFGPVERALASNPSAQLNPIDQFELYLGLQYDFF